MSRRDKLLDALAIGPQWTLRAVPLPLPLQIDSDVETGSASLPEKTVWTELVEPASLPTQYSDDAIAAMDWQTLQETVRTCTRCPLSQSRTHTVFGTGDVEAKWLLIGEGPGRNEDLQGEPFVGQAGKLLDQMLASIALRRGQGTFIANVVKCRPTDASGKDRAPHAEEIAACRPYLVRQIELIAPATLLALGKTAAVALLDCAPSTTLAKLRGTVHRYGNKPLVVTYHPAYLLRMLVDKRKSWEDLCLAVDTHADAISHADTYVDTHANTRSDNHADTDK
jgi:uracil-DNA glycosylase family 4